MLKRFSTDDGREEFVEPKVMMVLVALHEADGAILTREELMTACWPGVVVGDDALSRVISRLRRIAEGIGSDSFAIETHARVGCRLVTRETPDDSAAPAPQAAAEPQREPDSVPDPVPDSPRARRRRGWVVPAIGAMLVLLVVVALAAALRHRHGAGKTTTLHVAAIRPIGGGIPPLIPEMIGKQVAAAFASDAVIEIVDGPADFTVSGTIAAENGAAGNGELHYNLQLTDRGGGIVSAWTQKTSPTVLRSSTQAAVKIIGLVRCGLVPLHQYKGDLPRRLRNLSVQLCAGGMSGRRLDIAGSLTREAPDFAGGWQQLAYAYGSAAFGAPAPEAAAYAAKARAAASRAIALNPQSSNGYRVLAWMQAPGTPYATIEGYLRKAISAAEAGCACEHRDYGDFFLDTGQTNAAIGEYQRALDIEASGDQHLSLAHAWYFAGQPTRAGDELDVVETLWGDKDWMAFTHFDRAISGRQWAEAGRLVLRDADSDDERAIGNAFLAVAVGDRARIAALLPTIERIAQVPSLDRWTVRPPMLDERPTLLLMLMGQDQAALDAVQRLLARFGGDGGQLLFNPIAAQLRRAPGYVPLLEKAGLMAYWRASHTAPDYCSAADAPAFCATLR